MAKSLSVKIPTQLLIEEIEKNIANIEQEMATYDERMAQYEKDAEQYEQDVIKYALDNLVANPNGVVSSTKANSDWKTRASIDYAGDIVFYIRKDSLELPAKPVKPSNPNEKSYYGREYVTKLDLLKRNLRVLKMTTQETVSASTYNSVMELL